MTIIQDYVNALSDEEKLSVIESYDTFERSGAIGDEPIREHTTTFCVENNIPLHSIILWMQLMAFECHRSFSMRYIANLKRPT